MTWVEPIAESVDERFQGSDQLGTGSRVPSLIISAAGMNVKVLELLCSIIHVVQSTEFVDIGLRVIVFNAISVTGGTDY